MSRRQAERSPPEKQNGRLCVLREAFDQRGGKQGQRDKGETKWLRMVKGTKKKKKKRFHCAGARECEKKEREPDLITGAPRPAHPWRVTSRRILLDWPGFIANRKCGTKRDLF